MCQSFQVTCDVNRALWSVQKREAKGLSSRLRTSFAEATGERRGVAPGSFVDLLVNATDKATGESLSDLERTNQAFVMVMSGELGSSCSKLTHRCLIIACSCPCAFQIGSGLPRSQQALRVDRRQTVQLP